MTTTKVLLAGAAMLAGLGISATGVSAADSCCPTGCNEGCQSSCYSCSECDQIFKNAGCQLAADLERLGSSCCCNSECCTIADPCVADDCGDHCGEGCIGGDCGAAEPWVLCDGEGGIKVGGFAQFGYHSQNAAVARFNHHSGKVNLHQGWLYAEKVADGSDGMDWGFRTDFMYGVDGANTQSFGNRPGRFDYQNGWDGTSPGGAYGFALPQLYGEVAMGDLSIKAGHFFTLLGYEVVPATGNFFYSHALTMNNSEAFTHTGVLATYAINDNVTGYAGWTAGWDTGFDQLYGGSNFLGGFSTSVGENATFTYITTVGDLGWIGNGYSHSMVLDVALSDDWNYVAQSDVLRTNLGGAAANGLGVAPGYQIDTVGLNQYLFYTVSDSLRVGARSEWWKADGHSFFNYTLGANFIPHPNVVIRPEMRFDWGSNAGFGGRGTNGDQIAGCDAIVTF